MIKIEVTGNSIPEVADKLLAIGASLQGIKTTMPAFGWSDIKPEADAVGELREEIVFEPSVGNAPKSALTATATESPPTTVAPSFIPAEPAQLNFDTDVAPHVLALVKAKDKATAAAILSQFGVEKASLLDPARWPELVVALKGAV
jgi:hypothetical protein